MIADIINLYTAYKSKLLSGLVLVVALLVTWLVTMYLCLFMIFDYYHLDNWLLALFIIMLHVIVVILALVFYLKAQKKLKLAKMRILLRFI